MDKPVVIFVTVSNKDEGRKIARALVEERTAACVNILSGVESLYWWEGAIQNDAEELLVIKTVLSRFSDVERLVCSQHSYSVPEILALPVEKGYPAYVDWLINSVH